jgi:hypothetical protein
VNTAAAVALGVVAVAVLAGGSRVVSSNQAPDRLPEPRPPAPPSFPHPTTPSVPTEAPKPRAAPKYFGFKALRSYDVVVDVLPVQGVDLREMATKMLPVMGLVSPDFHSSKPAIRDGVAVSRVNMTVNSLLNRRVPMERQQSLAGVGSVWLVSAKEVRKF